MQNKAILAFALAGLFSSGGCFSDDPSLPRLRAEADELLHTTIDVGPAAPLDPSSNAIWAGSLKLAWDALVDELGGAVTLPSDSPALDQLTATDFDLNDVDARATTVHAGAAGPALVREVNRSLQRRGSPADPEFEAAVADAPAGSLFAYAELAKTLPFVQRFDDLASAPLLFHGPGGGEPTPVDAFGIASYSSTDRRHGKISEQLRFFEDRETGEFCVRLEPESDAGDRIVLARVAPGASLEATWKRAEELLAGDEQRLSEADRFVAPELDFDIARRFGELEGLVVGSPNSPGAPLAIVRQDIRLKLDEEGMTLRTRAFFGAASAAITDPRELLFDRPFLLAAFEAESGAPYLLAWIAHPELLAAAE